MRKPKILIATRSRKAFQLFFEQIRDYFKDSLEILDGEVASFDANPDLILASYGEIVNESKYPLEKLIVARRTVDISKIGDLVSLPSGTRCLVVNNSLDTAMETISCLQNLGMELEFLPYNSSSASLPEGVEVAVVPEGEELVPPGIKQVVYIGLRPIDYATILEIAFRLQIPVPDSQIYSSSYIRKIVKLSGKLSEALENERDFNQQTEVIFQTVHDGLIAIGKTGEVIQANRSAYKILGLNQKDTSLIGQKIWTIFETLSFQELSSKENIIISHNNMYLVINWTDIGQGRLGSVLAFQPVTRLQQLEQDIRQRVQGKGLSPRYTESDIVGTSKAINNTRKVMHKIAQANKSIVIFGESGTGKELFSHAIHKLSPLCSGPFITVNFSGLPEAMAERELFGYEESPSKGAPMAGKPGIFELAHKGTLLLDEIGDASPRIQDLLLRMLHEKRVRRMGGERLIPVDVRVIATTNKDLKALVQEGKFRSDLYFRLLVLPLHLPALRERLEDIPALVKHFIRKCSTRKLFVSDQVMDRLTSYNWPGNVRELEAAVEYMTSVAEDETITLSDLPPQLMDEVPLPTQDVDDVDFDIGRLDTTGNLIQFYTILESLHWAKENGSPSIGRISIVEQARQRDICITEQQARNRMGVLRRLGLIEIGNRRQGSRITDKGEVLLRKIRSLMEVSEMGLS